MEIFKHKKIHIDNLIPNMILAENIIITKDNIIFKHKNLTIDDCNKIKSLDIEYITVFDNLSNCDTRKNITVNRQIFEKEYRNATKNIEETFIAIGNGLDVDLEHLFSIVETLLTKLDYENELFMFVKELEAFDNATYSHCLNVGIIANMFGSWLSYDKERIKELTLAGILHDIGKIKIDKKILNKSSKLTEEEFAEMKNHSALGYELLKNCNVSDGIRSACLMHHEKMDGSGYPLGLVESQITDICKIVSICDIYDAMTADRVYREGICPFTVIKKFEQDSFLSLDTKFLLIFLQKISNSYIGSEVLLSNGLVGKVIFINSTNLSKPIIQLKDENFIDLKKHSDIFIESVLSR